MIRPHLHFLFLHPLIRLLRVLEIGAVALGLVMGMYIPISGQSIIDKSIYPESLTVGDKFIYVNIVEAPIGSKIEPVPLTERLGEAAVISDIFKIDNQIGRGISYACTLAVYQSGEIEIPIFTFIVADSAGKAREFDGDSLRVTIHSVLPADTAGLDIADIRGPEKVRGPIWPYFAIPIAIALISYIADKLYRRLRGATTIPEAPLRPPWEIAFEALDRFKEKRHYEFGRIKEYYFELSFIVREYIENRYNFPAVESTTDELAGENRLRSVGDRLYVGLFEFFTRADMAKFAKEIPTAADAAADLSFAYDLVKNTIPVIEESGIEKRAAAEAQNVQV